MCEMSKGPGTLLILFGSDRPCIESGAGTFLNLIAKQSDTDTSGSRIATL